MLVGTDPIGSLPGTPPMAESPTRKSWKKKHSKAESQGCSQYSKSRFKWEENGKSMEVIENKHLLNIEYVSYNTFIYEFHGLCHGSISISIATPNQTKTQRKKRWSSCQVHLWNGRCAPNWRSWYTLVCWGNSGDSCNSETLWGFELPPYTTTTQNRFMSISRWWFQTFFIFTPKLGEMMQIDWYVSKGLKPPTRFVCF